MPRELVPADKRLSVEGATAALMARPSAVLLGCSGGSVAERLVGARELDVGTIERAARIADC